MITKQDVARHAGVSTATVSRVINGVGYISEATKKKVQDAVLFLNYIPNKMARSLATNKSNVIAVLVEDLSNPYYMTLIDAMVERANQENHIVSIFAIKNRDVRLVLRDLASNMVCGIVNLAMFTCEFSNYDVFSNAGTKLINCTADSSVSVVDYDTGIEEAMQYLQDNGFRNVAFIGGLEEWLTFKDVRVKYFMENRVRHGFNDSNELILSADYPISRAYDVGYSLAMRLMDSNMKFDAVICLTDMMALGAVKAFYSRGYSLPDDISVIGCDNLDFAKYMHPALTTIGVDKKAEGYAYIDYILGKITELPKVATKLKIRESVKQR